MNIRFDRIFGAVLRRPGLTLLFGLILSLCSLLVAAQRMEFLTGRDDLMPKNTGFHRDYREWRQEFGESEEIVVVIEAADREKASAFGGMLYDRLRGHPTLFREVFYPEQLSFLRKNGLLLLPVNELRDLRDSLHMAVPLLKDLAASPSVQTLFSHLTSRIDAVASGSGNGNREEELRSVVFLLDKLGLGFDKFAHGELSSFSLEEFFLSGSGTESTLARAGKMQIITLLPVRDQASFTPSETAIGQVRKELAELHGLPQFKGVKAGLTGSPVLEHEEMATSQKDMAVATTVSLILTVILLLCAFRGGLNVIAAMVTIVMALCISFGFATLTVGHLNILSMVFAVMLIGIGIEYGIQVVLRYQEELKRGLSDSDAIRASLRTNVLPVTMAAATVAVAFLTFCFTDFKGIAELGIIAGGGIVICVVATFTVLPAMLALLEKFRKRGASGKNRNGASLWGAGNLLFGHPKAVIITAIVISVCSLYPLSRVRFDYNLMNLQAKGLESVEYAYKLMRSSENSGYFAAVMAPSRDEARILARKLETLPAVDHVVSLDTFVPERQDEKLAILADLRRELAGVKPVPYEEDLRVMELPQVFERFRDSVVRLDEVLRKEKRPDAKKVSDFLATLDSFFASLEKEKDRNALGMLRDFQGGMLAGLPEKIRQLKDSLPASPITEQDVPVELRKRFVGSTGKYLLQVAPKGEIFDFEPLKQFVSQVRQVDPHATGEPVMVYESMTIMRDSYIRAFIYASVAIIAILLMTFRSIVYTAIGLAPLGVGLLLLVSGMWLSGIDFNSANVIVMPLVLGIAVDSGIYLINRYRSEPISAVQVVTSSTGVGVFLNTLTIMASFGALMLARHQGVFSIGVVMTMGMIACQIAYMILLPAVLAVVGKRLRPMTTEKADG